MGAPVAIAAGDVAVELLDLDASPRALANWHATLDGAERDRAARFRHTCDRDRFIARRGQLRGVLADRLHCHPAEVRLFADDYGKLFLPDAPGMHLNLSSSSDKALVVIAAKPVGCDIERRDRELASPQIATRLFTAAECAELDRLHGERWLTGFFNCWTRKEAYVKAVGQGLSLPLNSFSVSVTPGVPAHFTSALVGWAVSSFEPAPGFQAAIVVATG